MSRLGFLLKKKFYIHLGYAVILTVILFFAVMKFLDIYTHHGEAFIVPDFTGATMEEVLNQNFGEVFDFIPNDSIYNNDLQPGAIVLQNPAPGSKVKKGRNIYITTVAFLPELTIMPDLKDLTLRQAITLLRVNGLGVRSLQYEPHMAENAVIGQYYDEDTIPAGTELMKGSKIDLILGQGGNKPVPVPFLVGLSIDNAHTAINLASFNIGKEYFLGVRDKEHSRVYRQEPDETEEPESYRGEYINTWYRSDLTFNFDSLIEVLHPDTTLADPAKIESPAKMIQ